MERKEKVSKLAKIALLALATTQAGCTINNKGVSFFDKEILYDNAVNHTLYETPSRDFDKTYSELNR